MHESSEREPTHEPLKYYLKLSSQPQEQFGYERQSEEEGVDALKPNSKIPAKPEIYKTKYFFLHDEYPLKLSLPHSERS